MGTCAFTKFYNKWYMAEEDKVAWTKSFKPKKVRILARMVSTFGGNAFQEVKLDGDNKWKPGSIFVVKDIKDVADVKGKLEESLFG